MSPSWPVSAQGITLPLLSQQVVCPVAGKAQPVIIVVVVVLVLVVVLGGSAVVDDILVVVVVMGDPHTKPVHTPLQHATFVLQREPSNLQPTRASLGCPSTRATSAIIPIRIPPLPSAHYDARDCGSNARRCRLVVS